MKPVTSWLHMFNPFPEKRPQEKNNNPDELAEVRTSGQIVLDGKED